VKTMPSYLLGLLVLAAPIAQADWHSGKLTALKFAYDGTTVTFNIAGYARTDCTCYANWSSDLCLNPSRPSFKAELAFLMSARARETAVFVNIDETTCYVTAMYEAG
jgi:hypothetical protein